MFQNSNILSSILCLIKEVDIPSLEVVEVAGNTVRIGVNAPRSVPVYREEIWAAVKEENQASAKAEAESMPRPERV